MAAPTHGIDLRSRRRRPLGVRLWLPDLAAGLRLRRARGSAAGRSTPGIVRLFVRPSRHAGAARVGAGARPGRRLPRHGVSCRGRQTCRDRRVSAGPRAGHHGLPRERTLRLAAERSRAADFGALLRGRPRARTICRAARRSISNCTMCGRATAGRAPTATTLSTVAALEEMGIRETELHWLAERLKGVHESGGVAASQV